jgi:hypothetical protein
MTYTVTWLREAEEALADVWLRASDRRAVTAAAHRIERKLRRDAHTKGSPVDDTRVIFDDLLAVTFTVSPDDCLVTITWVQEC